MNELISIADVAVRTLTTDVMHLLKTELGDQGTVGGLGNHILICIKQADFELRMGNILQQIYRVVDQHFPIRDQHISIVIRDANSSYENVFKIWKSV
jgi:hypothetical protein